MSVDPSEIFKFFGGNGKGLEKFSRYIYKSEIYSEICDG